MQHALFITAINRIPSDTTLRRIDYYKDLLKRLRLPQSSTTLRLLYGAAFLAQSLRPPQSSTTLRPDLLDYASLLGPRLT